MKRAKIPTMLSDYMENLRRYMVGRREQLNISQAELARRASVPKPTIGAIESGRVDNAPRRDTLEKIAKGLAVTYEVLDRAARGNVPEPAKGSTELDPEVAELARIINEMSPERRARYLKLMQAQIELLGGE